MVKTQIQLETWQYEALKRQASVTTRSMSDFIREAVTDALKKGKPDISLSEIAGKYAPIEGEPLKPHDKFWAESIR